jgi:hypothetical protein
MFRRLLLEQIKVVENGGDPINTFRDPAKNEIIRLSSEDHGDPGRYRKGGVALNSNTGTCSPFLDELDALMSAGAEAARRNSN